MSAVKLPELLGYVNIEEETLSCLQQLLLDFLKYVFYLEIHIYSMFLLNFSKFKRYFLIGKVYISQIIDGFQMIWHSVIGQYIQIYIIASH